MCGEGLGCVLCMVTSDHMILCGRGWVKKVRIEDQGAWNSEVGY